MVLPSFFILVPLYIYPSASPPAWKPLFDSISAYSNVTWKVVVNPNSGPGSGQYPNTDYIPAIAQLNNYTNVQTLGYVHTSYGTRNISLVNADTQVYAGWAGYKAADIHVDGIFFDESPTDTQYVNYMTQVNAYAKQNIVGKKPRTFTVFNTGVTTSAAYYSIADAVNSYENGYTVDPNLSQITTLPYVASWSAAVRANSSALIHDYNGCIQQLQADTIALMRQNLGGLYLTSAYNAFPSWLSNFTTTVARNVVSK